MQGWLDGKGGNGGRQTRWLTPKPLVEALGGFDLDPCGAPGHELAERTYLLERGEDGLELPWVGRVWLNPPYGREAEPFLEKLAEHGNGIALIFASTETDVFDRLVWSSAHSVLFIRGRINFATSDGKSAPSNAGKGSCLVAYDFQNAKALRESRIPGSFVDTSDSRENGDSESSFGKWLKDRRNNE